MACLPLPVYAGPEAGEELKVIGYGHGSLPVDHASHPEMIEEPPHGLRPAIALQVLRKSAPGRERLSPAAAGNDFRQRIERQAVEIETQEKGEAGGPIGQVVAGRPVQFVPNRDQLFSLVNRQSDLVIYWFH